MEHTIFPKNIPFSLRNRVIQLLGDQTVPIWNMATNLLFSEIYFRFSGMTRVPCSEKNTECSMCRMKIILEDDQKRLLDDGNEIHSTLASSFIKSVLLYSASLFTEQIIAVL